MVMLMRIMTSSLIILNLIFIMNVIFERYPYRYISNGVLENGKPDYRIQKFNDWTKRYNDMYLLDNSLQLDTAIEDFEYTKWLDPDPEVAAYAHNAT